MTFTLTALRTDLRASLQDGSSLLWTDAQLDDAIAQARDRYAAVRPQVSTATLTGISGREVTLSAAAPSGLGSTAYAALVSVDAVEYPLSQWPPSYVRYDVIGATLRLHVSTALSSESLKVYYSLLHTLDASAGTIVDEDRRLLQLGAEAYALRQLAAGKLDTLTTGSDVARRAAGEAAARLAAFEEGLRRLRRVRQHQLYRPDDPLYDRDIVAWPD